ncbi:MAG: hypothetical protein AB7W28_10325 [Armatimonadota bacterium]
MTAQPRIGLLPLYLELYDRVRPEARPNMEAFAQRVADRLSAGGLVVERAPICRLEAEVRSALGVLLARDVDLLATLHLAYSPSLESADVLAGLGLPLLLLDTTPAQCFAEQATSDDLFHNHGIHGVQDLACVLRRCERTFFLAVGHVDNPVFLQEAVGVARAACTSRRLRGMKVLVLGDEFTGMGDFAVEPEVLDHALGLSIERVPVAELGARCHHLSEKDVAVEARIDAERFDTTGLSPSILNDSNRVGLALRALLEERRAGAFSFNFQSFDRRAGVPTVPFLEASKAMARGIGYAGEGDALTAALVGALLHGFGDTTFTEMFCPDWEGGSVFMSHMGECNPALAAGRPKLVEKPYAFGDVDNPAIALFALEPGPATLVNIAPGPRDSLELLAARVQVLDRGPQPGFPDVPHFWLEPVDLDLPEFLRRYSEAGGTHHLALIKGEHMESIAALAAMLGLKAILLGK